MTAAETRFRLLEPADSLAELTRLLNVAYRPLADRGLRYVATYQDEDVTRRRAERGECFVGVQGERLVATVTLYDAEHTEGCPWYERPEVASFGQFAVAPDLQGRGIGRGLLRVVEQRAAQTGAHELALDTAEPADDLIELYARWGYRRVGYGDWDMTNYRSVILSKSLVERDAAPHAAAG